MKQFPGAWPESPVMESPSDSLEECHAALPSSATHLAEKPTPLRITVSPFSTDLTLPITPLSLPTPVSSSCFTSSDVQEFANASVPQTPTVALLASYSRNTALIDFVSPTSSQFLLMAPTPRVDVDGETPVCAPSLATPATVDEPMGSGSDGTKLENLCSWEVSASTWLSDLGGHSVMDRTFQHNPLETTLVDSDCSPASTPALSRSAVSPSSQVSSLLARNLPSARSPASLSLVLSSPYPSTMSPWPSSPARLALKPTGTDTFPSTLDSLQTWRKSITPGIPPSEESCSPLAEGDHGPLPEELVPEMAIYPSVHSHQLHSDRLSSHVHISSRSQTFMKRAKMLGGRVKQFVTLQNINKRRNSMDRGVRFAAVTSQDSEDGSVILIIASPSYSIRPLPLVRHGLTAQDHTRTRTISEYSVVQPSIGEVATTVTESGSRHSGRNRNALRRFSLAALSTIKRL